MLTPETFEQFKKEAKETVKTEAIKRFGFPNSGHLAKVAWWLIANDMKYIEMLEGRSKGSTESCETVIKVRDDAVKLLMTLHHLYLIYHSNGSFDQIKFIHKVPLPEELNNRINDSSKVFRKNAEYVNDDRHKKIRYCDLVLKGLLFFLLGLITGSLLFCG